MSTQQEIAAEILSLMPKEGRLGERHRMHILQDRLEDEFALRRGWVPIRGYRGHFDISRLASPRRPKYDYARVPHSFVDHRSCYYLKGTHRAAALIAQPYKSAFDPEELMAWAKSYGVAAEIVTDFPSWYYPGRTALVVYTRKQ